MIRIYYAGDRAQMVFYRFSISRPCLWRSNAVLHGHGFQPNNPNNATTITSSDHHHHHLHHQE